MQRHVPNLQAPIPVRSFACLVNGACLQSRRGVCANSVYKCHECHLELMPCLLSMPASTGLIRVTLAWSTPANVRLSSLSIVMLRTCDTSLFSPQLQGGEWGAHHIGHGVQTCVGVSSWCCPSRAAASGILAHTTASSSVGSSRAGRATETCAL